ncbi:hypothetical protein Csac_2659 [Caldicellulosiruptor saccharolyticus DSM 8903]|uniref:Fip n=1 Tax=Caldicellulosiruptor saccharolyticus (strain ATCC 43494 / DSM 8903 / Tp8T 6331) TaxID=351627 RepID=A4XMU5_CALS8|nr:DUF6710 family protein [Caldicellulosiruptor saccharolyticus]ABP68230.1 hypothetical protein Csac_2659 [Caldicellulosiruptor saccharolyticus DSM 8903]
MFEKLLRKKKTDVSDVAPKREFHFVLDFIQKGIEDEDREGKIEILSFVEKLLKEDLRSDMLTKIIYNPDNMLNRTSWFPQQYLNYDSSSTPIIEVDLSTAYVIAYPWNSERYKKMIKTLGREDFKYDKINHFAEYYVPLGICFVTNGHHSIAAGCGYKKGSIKAKQVDITPLFDKIYTDGQSWYESDTGKKIFDVPDFRIAILFEIAKMKYKLQNN